MTRPELARDEPARLLPGTPRRTARRPRFERSESTPCSSHTPCAPSAAGFRHGSSRVSTMPSAMGEGSASLLVSVQRGQLAVANLGAVRAPVGGGQRQIVDSRAHGRVVPLSGRVGQVRCRAESPGTRPGSDISLRALVVEARPDSSPLSSVPPRDVGIGSSASIPQANSVAFLRTRRVPV